MTLGSCSPRCQRSGAVPTLFSDCAACKTHLLCRSCHVLKLNPQSLGRAFPLSRPLPLAQGLRPQLELGLGRLQTKPETREPKDKKSSAPEIPRHSLCSRAQRAEQSLFAKEAPGKELGHGADGITTQSRLFLRRGPQVRCFAAPRFQMKPFSRATKRTVQLVQLSLSKSAGTEVLSWALHVRLRSTDPTDCSAPFNESALRATRTVSKA